MITTHQCRAARGLIGWTQQDLATKSGLSKTAINNFEKGRSHIKAESLHAICTAFQHHGVEFLGINGLRLHNNQSYMIDRADLFANITSTIAAEENSEILAILYTEELAQDIIRHFTGAATRWRILTPRGLGISLQHSAIEHRYLRNDVTGMEDSILLYGDKISTISSILPRACITDSRTHSQQQRHNFLDLWNTAKTAA